MSGMSDLPGDAYTVLWSDRDYTAIGRPVNLLPVLEVICQLAASHNFAVEVADGATTATPEGSGSGPRAPGVSCYPAV